MIKGTDNIHDALEKVAALGVGMRVKDIDREGAVGVNVGFPYGAAIDYRLMNKARISPTIGFGLLGPHIGISVRGKKGRGRTDLFDDALKKYRKAKRAKKRGPSEKSNTVRNVAIAAALGIPAAAIGGRALLRRSSAKAKPLSRVRAKRMAFRHPVR